MSIAQEMTCDENNARVLLENWARWAWDDGMSLLNFPGRSAFAYEMPSSNKMGYDYGDALKADTALLRLRKRHSEKAFLLHLRYFYRLSDRKLAKELKIGRTSVNIYTKIALSLFFDYFTEQNKNHPARRYSDAPVGTVNC